MGRRKLPTELKKAQGTYRASREKKNQPAPQKLDYLVAPEHLNIFAREEWERVVPELSRTGVLTSVDIGALTLAIIQYGIAVEAYVGIYTFIDDDGKRKTRTLFEYLKGKNAKTVPEISLLYRAYDAYKKMITEFGMTPASRGNLEVAPPKEVNSFDQFKE